MRVVVPTTMKTDVTVPRSRSQSAIVSGILSPRASGMTMTNWPGRHLRAISGASTSRRWMLGTRRSRRTTRGISGPSSFWRSRGSRRRGRSRGAPPPADRARRPASRTAAVPGRGPEGRRGTKRSFPAGAAPRKNGSPAAAACPKPFKRGDAIADLPQDRGGVGLVRSRTAHPPASAARISPSGRAEPGQGRAGGYVRTRPSAFTHVPPASAKAAAGRTTSACSAFRLQCVSWQTRNDGFRSPRSGTGPAR